jgi:hemophore-related protein
MLLSARSFRRVVVEMICTGVMAGAMLVGGVPLAFAQPTPEPPPAPPATPQPGCTAADLAQVSAGVAAATSVYLFSHPDVNDFFTSLHGRPSSEIPDDVQNYMNANPQVQSDLTAIRQPMTDLRNRCQ